MNPLAIYIWLQNIDDSCHSFSDTLQSSFSDKQQRKRKPLYQQPSPPVSVASWSRKMPKTPSPKKRKIGDSIDSHRPSDAEATPRQSDTGMSSRISVTSSTSLPPSEPVPRSGSASPRRAFMSLRLDDSGIECRQLDSENPPAPAADLVQQFCEIDMGMGILPSEMENDIKRTLRTYEQNERLWKQAFDDQGPDKLPGFIPSWEQVSTVRQKAMQCFNESHEEASWNNEVHHRLLEATFRGPTAEPGQPFDFMTWYVLPTLAPSCFPYLLLNKHHCSTTQKLCTKIINFENG